MGEYTQSATLQKIIDGCIEEMKSEIQAGSTRNQISDLIHEWADSGVPVYNSDRVDILSEDLSLGSDQPELGSEEKTVFGLLGAVIYEVISNALFQQMDELLDSEDDEDYDDEDYDDEDDDYSDIENDGNKY